MKKLRVRSKTFHVCKNVWKEALALAAPEKMKSYFDHCHKLIMEVFKDEVGTSCPNNYPDWD